MTLISIPALTDKYIWRLYNNARRCLVDDPGEASPVLQVFDERQLLPVAILLTHHHYDYVKGVKELLQHYPQPVSCPEETKGATTSSMSDFTAHLWRQNYRQQRSSVLRMSILC
nr:MBL fold metallo-hydrolase [Candidatus Hoaglandella endobia]